MCTVESPIHQNIKEKIVASTEQDTVHMFRSASDVVIVLGLYSAENHSADSQDTQEHRPGIQELRIRRGRPARTPSWRS